MYGDDVNQFADLAMPDGGSLSVPVVVLIHGGFWRTGYGLDLMEPLVPSLLDAGCAVLNIEYRRVGAGPEGGGGYPQTFDDVAAAIDVLARVDVPDRSRLDLDRVATVGHSAGGHLAVWLAARSVLPSGRADSAVGERWDEPQVRPVLAVSQAGVLDLARCIDDRVGGSAGIDLLGAASLPARISVASPIELVPFEARVLAVHGALDRIVPLDQSEGFVEAARNVGAVAELLVFDEADHFSVIDPTHESWTAVLDALRVALGLG